MSFNQYLQIAISSNDPLENPLSVWFSIVLWHPIITSGGLIGFIASVPSHSWLLNKINSFRKFDEKNYTVCKIEGKDGMMHYYQDYLWEVKFTMDIACVLFRNFPVGNVWPTDFVQTKWSLPYKYAKMAPRCILAWFKNGPSVHSSLIPKWPLGAC